MNKVDNEYLSSCITLIVIIINKPIKIYISIQKSILYYNLFVNFDKFTFSCTFASAKVK